MKTIDKLIQAINLLEDVKLDLQAEDIQLSEALDDVIEQLNVLEMNISN